MIARVMQVRARGGSGLALGALALGAFTIGTAELLVVGVLPLATRDLGVPVSAGGLLVTAYAVGVSLGGPLVTLATIRMARRVLLWLALTVYAAGNLLAAAAPSFGALVAARVVTGTVHGVFIGAASAMAASLVPPDHRGRAMSMVFGGIAASTVVGVPLGTLAGQLLGWRAAFTGVVVLSGLALAAAVALLPPVAQRGGGGLSAQVRFAFAPRVLAMLAFGLVVIGGQFTAFTYLAPFLEQVTGVAGGLISAFLLAYGIAAAAGTFAGGRLADRSPVRTVVASSAVLVVALGVLLAAGRIPAAALAALAVWGLAGFALVPAFQLRVISLAGKGGDLAATLGASAVNAGIAAGAAAGGWVVGASGVRGAVLAALVCCAVAVPMAAATGLLKIPGGDTATGPDTPGKASSGATAAAQACCRISGRIQAHLPAHGHHLDDVAPHWLPTPRPMPLDD